MAVEKGKVITALDAKYKGKKSLSKHFKDQFATIAADLIDEDAGIEEYLTQHEPFINLTISEGDRRASQAVIKTKNEIAGSITDKDEPAKQDAPTGPALPDDAPSYMKDFMEQMKQLTQTVTGLQQARTTETLTDRFKKDDRLKGIPEVLLTGRIPTKEEDFEAFVTAAVTDLKPIADKLGVAGFGNDKPVTVGGGGTTTAGNGKPAPEVLAFATAQAKGYEAKQQSQKN